MKIAQQHPDKVERSHYTPPAFLIEHVTLTFDLGLAETTVVNKMSIRRNPIAPRSDRLVLHGKQLDFISAFIKGVDNLITRITDQELQIDAVPDVFELTVTTNCRPANNTALCGLFVSDEKLITQCEAEGFRRITYFLDRPDVLAFYTVIINADKQQFPILLSNGNLIEEGELADGRHFARWEDPFKKPSYLFALVAGRLVAREARIKTLSRKEKLLQVWVDAQDIDKTQHAMNSLIRAIEWDEKHFGLELDLDRFMIVAVNDFTMGAMENKGLNIFNTKYVLADSAIATDVDFENVESIVAHEYFHNWTGNRVTCRDWFQLTLKEGLTVFREQEFAADSHFSTSDAANWAVRRIKDVRILRLSQFTEDVSPMAHPVRPDSYIEISNFYTATVYKKGAEIVRMYQTLLGRLGFREGLRLYLERHDGQAVVCEDLLVAMEDANDCKLINFDRWYSRVGTPQVTVRTAYDAVYRTYKISLTQAVCDPPLRNDTNADPLLIPFAIGLLDNNGSDIPLRFSDEPLNQTSTTKILQFSNTETSFTFVDIPEEPIPSLLRHFSAPIAVAYEYSTPELTFLFRHDSDLFNRWDAGQSLATRTLVGLAESRSAGKQMQMDESIVDAYAKVLLDETLSPAFRELAITLPPESYICALMKHFDPLAAHLAHRFLKKRIATLLVDHFRIAYKQHRPSVPCNVLRHAAGSRALSNVALLYLSELDDPSEAVALAISQYRSCDNMSDRLAAMLVFLNASSKGHATLCRDMLHDFYERYKSESLAIDTWFSLQAMQLGRGDGEVLRNVKELTEHAAFRLENPNRVYSLLFTFCQANPAEFHLADNSGYLFWTEKVLALDSLNPMVAARLARVLDMWRSYVPHLRSGMFEALETIAALARSDEVLEVVSSALR